MTEIANSSQVLERYGGDDETRTRDLCRDSLGMTSLFSDLRSSRGLPSRCKDCKNRVWWVSLWVEINLQNCSTAADPAHDGDYKWEPSVSVRMRVKPQKLWVESRAPDRQIQCLGHSSIVFQAANRGLETACPSARASCTAFVASALAHRSGSIWLTGLVESASGQIRFP